MTSFETCLLDKISLYVRSKVLPMYVCWQITAVFPASCIYCRYLSCDFLIWTVSAGTCLLLSVPFRWTLSGAFLPSVKPLSLVLSYESGLPAPLMDCEDKVKRGKTGRSLLVRLPCGCYRYNRPRGAGDTLHLVLLPSHFSGFTSVFIRKICVTPLL